MEQIGFTPLQKTVFTDFAKQEFAKSFYFTGGTALSVFYLHHRESEDLDFFSEEDFENDFLLDYMSKLTTSLKLEYRFTQKYKARIFEIVDKNKMLLKIDFVHYPYKRIEQSKVINNLSVDSLRDIGTNKLMTINQRIEVKDFVDLYFLLKHFTLWDLLYGIKSKFRLDLDLVMIASDFMKVEEFDFLPKMLVPLTLKELTAFFRLQAKQIGERIKA